MLAFARALGDFGTTLMLAGNIPGRTTTMPIAIYDALLMGDQSTLILLMVIMSFIAVCLIVIVNQLGGQSLN